MWSIPVDRITLDGAEQVPPEPCCLQSVAPERRAYLRAGHLREPEGPGERRYFKQVRTRLQLPKEQI